MGAGTNGIVDLDSKIWGNWWF